MREWEPGDTTDCMSCGGAVTMQDTLAWHHQTTGSSLCPERHARPLSIRDAREAEVLAFFKRFEERGVTHKTDNDLREEAAIWAKYGDVDMAQILLDAIGTQP